MKQRTSGFQENGTPLGKRSHGETARIQHKSEHIVNKTLATMTARFIPGWELEKRSTRNAIKNRDNKRPPFVLFQLALTFPVIFFNLRVMPAWKNLHGG